VAYRFKLTHVFPASPDVIYDTWLRSRGHTAMTGSKAKMSARIGGRYTAWDGYISGRNLILEPGKRIVQSWRTTEFTDADEDSKITVTLTPVKAGTRLTLVHSDVPDGHTSYENGGWRDCYFKPMGKYFGKSRKTPAR
jgi:activator of HSP90 ATPase